MIIMKELLGNRIKAAIFDIDGTLLDSMPMWQDVCSRYLLSIGITPEPDLSKKVFSMTLKEGCKYTKEQYNLDISEDEIEDGIIKLIEHFYYYEVELKPGAKELIMELNAKNIPMVLATTGDEDLATHALLRNGIFNYFKKLYTCGEYNTSKRERYIFDLAKTELETILGSRLDYENIAVFEDSLTAIRTTKDAGFFVVGLRDDACLEEQEEIKKLADCYYESLTNIQ